MKQLVSDVIGRDRREYKIFRVLLDLIPGLEERITSSDDEVAIVGELVSLGCPRFDFYTLISLQLRKGAAGARGDDTKSLKGAILDWITPKGQSLTPPIARNVKVDRGFNHERTGALLCPTGLDWSNQV